MCWQLHFPSLSATGPVDRWRLRALPECDPFVAQLQRSLWWATAAVALVLRLYLMQFLIVRRAQGILEDRKGGSGGTRYAGSAGRGADRRTEAHQQPAGGEISERRQAQSKLNYLAYR